jgi:hypothetical protein
VSINKHAALRILILSIAIPLLSSSTAVTAQNAQLNGTVSLPPTKVKKKRVFRGSEYRSRLSTSKGPTKQTAPTRRSRFDDVVVSLPRSPSRPISSLKGNLPDSIRGT